MATMLLARAMQTRMASNAAFNQPTIVVDSNGAIPGSNGAPGVSGQGVPATTYSTVAIAAAAAASASNTGGAKKKRPETLFGPDLGAGGEADEAGWVDASRASAGGGEGTKVSLDTVRNWVERAKSEEGVHPTTTLQALVNLKRPTLQLTPVAAPDIASPTAASGQRHALSFTYDASTPRVRITLSLHAAPGQPGSGGAPITLYEGTHAGGFGKTFRLNDESALDLAAAVERARAASMDDGSTDDGKSAKDPQGSGVPDLASGLPAPADPPSSATTPAPGPTSPRRRFPFIGGRGRRAREADLEAQIIAEAAGNTYNADQRGEGIEMTETGAGGAQVEGTQPEAKNEEGMRVLITIAGLQENDRPLDVPNSQLTHILIMGVTASTGDASAAELSTAEATQRRVWVIKVVRREAIIGSHCFLLKEIYGLASSSTSDEAAAPPATTYPPTAGAAEDPYASTPNECIVCLTSPRDVVLLPCRHLVVCRECAVGMIEFGAGGKVARREDATEPTADAAGGMATPGEPSTGATAAAAPIPAPTRERRKKKAKGWFCPVCRQPYTSLLRLALPSSEDGATAESHLHQLSRAPSAAGGASLRRVSSRATLPERGERMLEEITPSQPDDVDDRDVVAENGAPHEPATERPQFVLGEEVSAHEPARAATPIQPTARTSTEGRRSVEGGGGWKQVV